MLSLKKILNEFLGENLLYRTVSWSGLERMLTIDSATPKHEESFVSFSEIPFVGDISSNTVTVAVKRPNGVEKVSYTEQWFRQHEEQGRYIAGEGWGEQFVLPDECFDEEGEEDEECVEQAYMEAEIDAFLVKGEEREWISKIMGEAIKVEIIQIIVYDKKDIKKAEECLTKKKVNIPIKLISQVRRT